MRKLLVPLFLLAALLFNPFVEDAYAFNKSGAVGYHNYISMNKWTFDSLKIGSTDSAVLYQDSATTKPFTTASLGRIQNVQATAYDLLPDSMALQIAWAGEADAVSLRVNVLVSVLGASGPFVQVGTPDTLTMTGATKATSVVSIPVARRFYPDAHYYVELKTTTATDTARIYSVKISPLYR